MNQALDVFWESLRDWWNGMVGLAVMNFIWLLMSLTVVLLPPATAAMYTVTNSLAHGTGSRLEDFGAGARRYAAVSYRWALVNVLAAAIVVAGFVFYGALGSVLGVMLQVLFGAGGILWIMAQFYVWPFLLEQEQTALRLALKNALFLTLANPVYSFILLGMVALALVISVATMLPIAVFLTSFVSLLGNRAVLERLRAYGKLPGSPHVSGEEL